MNYTKIREVSEKQMNYFGLEKKIEDLNKTTKFSKNVHSEIFSKAPYKHLGKIKLCNTHIWILLKKEKQKHLVEKQSQKHLNEQQPKPPLTISTYHLYTMLIVSLYLLETFHFSKNQTLNFEPKN